MIKIHRPECPYPQALADQNYKHARNKQALVQANHGKCMYCEAKITHINFGDVEHIKPKQLFPELEFVWENLGLVCDRCNNEKRNKYDASAPFVDPYAEEPANEILCYGPFLFPKNGSERGEYTIAEIKLNRVELVEHRDNRIKAVYAAYNAACRLQSPAVKESALRELLKEAQNDKEYSSAISALFKSVGL